MKIKTRMKEKVAIVAVEGNIDINASDFIEAIGWLVNNRSKKILCNFSGVNLVDYLGVSVLAIIYKNVLNRSGVIKFCNVPPHVKKLFAIVGLSRVLEVYETEADALLSFRENKKIAKIMKQKLRRRFKRIPFKKVIEYKALGARDTFFRGRMLNISAVGVFLVGEKIFKEGELLSLRLHLSPAPGIISVEAKVAWVSGGDASILEYPAMGLEFHQISSQTQKDIMDFVNKHLASKGF